MRRATGLCNPRPEPQGISIHALLAESDSGYLRKSFETISFLSTLSLRRATQGCAETRSCWSHFYPRSPCGERQTSLLRRSLRPRISIHALLAESDGRPWAVQLPAGHFYPRSPCGERQHAQNHVQGNGQFLSTLSLRRATALTVTHLGCVCISIHALLAESDVCIHQNTSSFCPFLSTLSLRRATIQRAIR